MEISSYVSAGLSSLPIIGIPVAFANMRRVQDKVITVIKALVNSYSKSGKEKLQCERELIATLQEGRVCAVCGMVGSVLSTLVAIGCIAFQVLHPVSGILSILTSIGVTTVLGRSLQRLDELMGRYVVVEHLTTDELLRISGLTAQPSR